MPRRMVLMIGMYVSTIPIFLLANKLFLNGDGYEAFSPHTIKHKVIVYVGVTIALAIINEARASGLWSGIHWWRTRSIKTLMWLTAPLALRGVVLYIAAIALGLEHPLVFAGAGVATDPAAVGLAVGLVGETRYLAGLSWQLTVESLYNDIIGLAVIGIGAGYSAHELGVSVGNSIVIGLGLAVVCALIAEVLRTLGLARRFEFPMIWIATAICLFIVGQHELGGIIFVGVVASSVFDLLEAVFIRNAASKADHHAIRHQWELGNIVGLTSVLACWALLFPINGAIREGWTGLAYAAISLGLIITTRFISAYGEERSDPVVDQDGSINYGPEAVFLLWLAGSSLLGVPMLGALENYAMGGRLAPVVIFEMIGLSLLLVGPTVKRFIFTEVKYADRFDRELDQAVGVTPDVQRLIDWIRRRQPAHRTADHPEVPHESDR